MMRTNKAMNKRQSPLMTNEIMIRVTKHMNGYQLQVDEQSYMYFTAQSLLEGFVCRVGLQMTGTMQSVMIKRIARAVMHGSVIRELTQEVKELQKEVNTLRLKRWEEEEYGTAEL